MKAFVLYETAPVGTKPLKLENLDRPKISGHEILVKIQASGICHTDVHIIEGEVFKTPKLPLIPGHEIAGTVEEAGEKTQDLSVGERVGIGWTYNSCLKCGSCLKGQENLCTEREATGYTKNGGYAEYVKLDSRFVTKIPEKLKSEHAAPLFCAGLTAYRAAKRLGSGPGEKVAVVGIGGLGSYAVQFLKILGCRVFAFSRNENHLRFAEKLGAERAINSSGNFSEEMKKLKINLALNFAPSGKVLEKTLVGIGRGGKVVNAGNIEKITGLDYRKALAGEKTLTTVSTGTLKDMQELINLAAGGKVKSEIEAMRLEEANEALARVKEGKVSGRIVLV